ncbi:guanylate kinase [Mycoplasmoides pirum]|uniref:guanylate kinase n=1 Tax=Mycoplasmoides pirum TaxID=2122 RepID=UPI000AD2A22C|nr:guanylate kinase [Mycoplasmoides pirum]
MKGFIILISGPSGVGKGTIIEKLMKYPELKLVYSISATTRNKRIGEIDGKHYFFKSHDEFEKMIKNNELLEYAKYVNNYYGTPMSQVESILNSGNNLLLEIEYQGVIQVLKKIPESISIFITPPSFKELYNRLKNRGSETIELIDQRIDQAKKELCISKKIYKYVIVNDILEETVKEIYNILAKEINIK